MSTQPLEVTVNYTIRINSKYVDRLLKRAEEEGLTYGDPGKIETIQRLLQSEGLAVIDDLQDPAAHNYAILNHQSNQMADITAPEAVQIQIRSDSKVIWVNVDGMCRLRCCQIKHLEIDDMRKEND